MTWPGIPQGAAHVLILERRPVSGEGGSISLLDAPVERPDCHRSHPVGSSRAAMPGIFISYRRTDAKGFAGALLRELKLRFGPAHVFMDVEDIDGGTDFPVALERAVDTCDILLALIGPGWLEARDAAGARRLEDPRDFVREEIRRALGRGIRVIPVLLDGAPLPPVAALPDDLAPLAARNGLDLTNAHWEDQVDHLTDQIQHGLFDHAGAQLPADFVSLPPERRGGKPMFTLMAIGLFVTSAVMAFREHRFIVRAAHGQGTVVDLDRRTSRDREGRQSSAFYPVVEFRAQSGQIVRIVSSLGSDPPAYAIGEAVPVLYERATPESGCIDSFNERWGLALMCAGIGLPFFAIGFVGPYCALWIHERRFRALRRDGQPIVTALHSVQEDRIVTEWRNPLSKKIVHFRSPKLSVVPTFRAQKRLITVLVDPNNLRRYAMDLSFLQTTSDTQAKDP
jgi:hypothetical protein